MHLKSPKILLTVLTGIILLLHSSCTKDELEDTVVLTEDLQSTRLQAEATHTVTLTPINDSYLKGSANYNRDIIRLTEYERNAYLMFDLSQIDGEITSATLQFRISGYSGSGTINVHWGKGTAWTENNLSRQNRPQPYGLLGSINKSYPMGSTQKISLKASSLGTERTSLILLHRDGVELAFDSAESSNPPKLTITYSSSGSTQKAQTVPKGYFVTTNGKSTNNGLSEGSSWSLEHAINTASAGDVVYVKAGNYGNLKLIPNKAGTPGNPIKFIGYSSTPGDINSSNGSTFHYGDKVSASKMPLLTGNAFENKIGIRIQKDYVEIHNFQLQGYNSGIVVNGNHAYLKNIITYETGPQNVNSGSGKALMIYGNNAIVTDCFDYNSTSQGITISGSSNSIVSHCKVYSDNRTNPNGYYILLTGGSKNSVVEDCIVFRDKDADRHRGHGLVLKDMATNNTIRNSFTYNTGIEVNFAGVSYNTFDNIKVYGSYTSDHSEFSSNISVNNGAHNNTFKNISLNDARYAISFHDYNDGYVGSGGNRDLTQGGSNNQFINVQVNKAKNIIAATSQGGVGKSAYSNNNEFTNCSFKDITGTPFFSYQTVSNTKLINCRLENVRNSQMIKEYSGGKIPLNLQGCSYVNVGFSIPK